MGSTGAAQGAEGPSLEASLGPRRPQRPGSGLPAPRWPSLPAAHGSRLRTRSGSILQPFRVTTPPRGLQAPFLGLWGCRAPWRDLEPGPLPAARGRFLEPPPSARRGVAALSTEGGAGTLGASGPRGQPTPLPRPLSRGKSHLPWGPAGKGPPVRDVGPSGSWRGVLSGDSVLQSRRLQEPLLAPGEKTGSPAPREHHSGGQPGSWAPRLSAHRVTSDLLGPWCWRLWGALSHIPRGPCLIPR